MNKLRQNFDSLLFVVIVLGCFVSGLLTIFVGISRSDKAIENHSEVYTDEICFQQCQMDRISNMSFGLYRKEALKCYQLCTLGKHYE